MLTQSEKAYGHSHMPFLKVIIRHVTPLGDCMEDHNENCTLFPKLCHLKIGYLRIFKYLCTRIVDSLSAIKP